MDSAAPGPDRPPEMEDVETCDLLLQMHSSLQRINGKLDSLTIRMDQMKTCLDKLDNRLKEVEARVSTNEYDTAELKDRK